VLQLGCQVPPLLKSGFRFERPRFGHPGARKIAKLLVPRALGSGIYQINVFVDSILASFESIVGPGGQSALYYSNRLFQLPLAVFGLALAQAILPTFSTQVVKNDLKGLKETLAVACRSLAFVALPAAAGLIALAEPIVRIIFERGKFDSYSTGITSSALFFYAFGLLSCCLVKIFVNVFYAMQDTRTPVKIMGVSVALNVALSLALMGPLKIGGLALASSVSATLNLLLLYRALRRRIGPLGARAAGRDLLKILFCAAAMGAVAFAYGRWALAAHAEMARGTQAGLLGVGIAASVAFYFALTHAARVPEARRIASWKRG
jgi:putative peptidoglycan lipid II flippase